MKLLSTITTAAIAGTSAICGNPVAASVFITAGPTPRIILRNDGIPIHRTYNAWDLTMRTHRNEDYANPIGSTDVKRETFLGIGKRPPVDNARVVIELNPSEARKARLHIENKPESTRGRYPDPTPEGTPYRNVEMTKEKQEHFKQAFVFDF